MARLSQEQAPSVAEGCYMELRHHLQTAFGVADDALWIEKPMNYSYSYGIQVGLDGQCNPKPQEVADFLLSVRISIRANVFTTYEHKAANIRHFLPVMDATTLPECVVNLREHISNNLIAKGWVLLQGEVLKQPVEGYLTELDNYQANVFEVFFDEMQ